MSVSLSLTPSVVTDRPTHRTISFRAVHVEDLPPGDAIRGPFHDPAQHSNALHTSRGVQGRQPFL